eukprot:1004322_1
MQVLMSSLMSMDQLPMEQSLVVSDIDWKQDPYNVIAEDENGFNEASQDLQQNVAFDDPPQTLCEQSWGLYFAHRSPAMGTIDGTSRLRVSTCLSFLLLHASLYYIYKLFKYFSHNSLMVHHPILSTIDWWYDILNALILLPMTNHIALSIKPQTPPENVNFLNESLSAPPTIARSRKVTRPYLFGDDMDAGLKHNPVPQLSIADLMSPEKRENIEHKDDETALFNEDKFSPISSKNESDDRRCRGNLLPRFDDCIADLQEAIQNAIQRRRSLEPQIIINQNSKSMNSMNISNAENASHHIVTTPMSGIRQLHRFIQFYVDPQQMLSNDIEYIKQECNGLIEGYVSKLQDINSDRVAHHTSWHNINTNQCTFHLLMNHHSDEKDMDWSHVFVGMLQSHRWIDSSQHEMLFSQLIPQQS